MKLELRPTHPSSEDDDRRRAAADRPRADWNVWIQAGKVVVVTRFVFLTVAFLASWLLSTSTFGAAKEGVLEVWERWDAAQFINIAKHGYDSPQSDPNGTAFFPLFPLAVRAGMAIGLHPVAAGLLINSIATAVALVYLYKLAERDAGAGAGRRAMLYLSFFPTAVFLVAPYSEPLFLAGAIAAFYYARQGRWHLVAVPAAVAMGARFAGVFLLFGLFVEFVRQRRLTFERVANATFSLVVGFLPALAYAAYLAHSKGNALQFFVDQDEGWARHFVGFTPSFRTTWDTWHGGYPTNWMLAWRLEILGAVAGLAIVLWAVRKREWGYVAFMGTMLFTLVTSSYYMSIPRILLSFFPVAMFAAEATREKPEQHEWILLISGSLAILGVVVFTRGAWFY